MQPCIRNLELKSVGYFIIIPWADDPSCNYFEVLALNHEYILFIVWNSDRHNDDFIAAEDL